MQYLRLGSPNLCTVRMYYKGPHYIIDRFWFWPTFPSHSSSHSVIGVNFAILPNRIWTNRLICLEMNCLVFVQPHELFGGYLREKGSFWFWAFHIIQNGLLSCSLLFPVIYLSAEYHASWASCCCIHLLLIIIDRFWCLLITNDYNQWFMIMIWMYLNASDYNRMLLIAFDYNRLLLMSIDHKWL